MNFNDLKTKPKILIGICSPMVLLLILGAVAIYNINTITKTAGRVDHTRIVLADSSAIVGSAVDMETGMRGYLLAGKEGFLDPYKGGEKATYEEIKKLQETVSDNPGQVARLGEVEKTLRAWQTEVTEPTIALRREIGTAKTMDDMADLVGEARGKVYFDKFRDQIRTFISRETTLLETRRAEFASAQGVVAEQFGLVDKTVGWVSHTYKVLADAKDILSNAVDMETGMRGFLLAGKDKFLDPYKSGQQAFAKNIKALQDTVSDNSPQVARLKKAEKLITDWQKQVTEPAIKMRLQVRSGNGSMTDIEAMVGREAGKKFFDAFRGVIAEFSAIETKLLNTRQGDAKTASGEVNTNLKIMKDNEGWVTHTYKVIGSANSALSAAVDMETGMRGYLLAGQDGFLDPYKGGQASFDKISNGLLKTVNDNPAQVELMTGIQTTIREWVKNVTKPTIDLRRQIGDSKTMNDMAALVGEARGKVFFDKFRGLMGEFQAEEEGLMESRQAQNIKTVDTTFTLIVACIIIALIIGLGLAWLIGNGIANPIKNMTDTMAGIAGGDLELDVPGVGRADEIGNMADAVQVFKDSAIENNRLQNEQEAIKHKAEEDKRLSLNQMADSLDDTVSASVNAIVKNSKEILKAATGMGGSIDKTASGSMEVAEASIQTSNDVAGAASATTELTASIQEISRQVSTSSEMASSAVTEANQVNTRIQSLSTAVEKIGEVVSLISDIAEQTNLLALNATIESARAGEAGKGFAVVASEVKNLATETAKATSQIGEQIDQIKEETNQSVIAIDGITKTISNIDEVATAIAAAVEEQGAATNEISNTVERVNESAKLVANKIAGVTQNSASSYGSSIKVLWAAEDLEAPTKEMKDSLDQFLKSVRT